MNIEGTLKKLRELEQVQSRQKGQLESLLSRLREEFQVKSFEEAEEYLQTLEKEITKTETKLEEMSEELENKLSTLKKAGLLS